VHWHADFSWAGLRGTAAAIRQLQAKAWLMSAADYTEALAGPTDPLKGRTEQSPWDPELADRMRATGRAVAEDRVLPALLAELTARAAPRPAT
jgi:hypothetical protein